MLIVHCLSVHVVHCTFTLDCVPGQDVHCTLFDGTGCSMCTLYQDVHCTLFTTPGCSLYTVCQDRVFTVHCLPCQAVHLTLCVRPWCSPHIVWQARVFTSHCVSGQGVHCSLFSSSIDCSVTKLQETTNYSLSGAQSHPLPSPCSQDDSFPL